MSIDLGAGFCRDFDMSMGDATRAIHAALIARERRDVPLWAMSLVRPLEQKHRGAAFEWWLSCLAALLDAYPSSHQAVRSTWLDELKRLKSSPDPSDDAIRLSREVWYFNGIRDDWQTSASRLLESLVAYLAKNEASYEKAIAHAVAVVIGEGCDLTTPPLDAVILKFREALTGQSDSP